jgi:cytochrome P450
MRVNLGLRPIIGISSPEAINEILRDRPGGYRRWLDQRAVIEEMGPPGLFIVEGDDWKRQRRLVVTALNTNHIHRYFEIVRLSTDRLHRRLLEAARQCRTLDICDELTSYTVDITSALALGHDLNTLERGDGEIQGYIRRVMQMTGRRLAAPFAYWRYFRLPADRALDRSTKQMHSAIGRFIKDARERMDARTESYEKPVNLLEGMLAAQKTDDSAFTDEEIAGNVFVILLAGEDTTAHPRLDALAARLATRVSASPRGRGARAARRPAAPQRVRDHGWSELRGSCRTRGNTIEGCHGDDRCRTNQRHDDLRHTSRPAHASC